MDHVAIQQIGATLAEATESLVREPLPHLMLALLLVLRAQEDKPAELPQTRRRRIKRRL